MEAHEQGPLDVPKEEIHIPVLRLKIRVHPRMAAWPPRGFTPCPSSAVLLRRTGPWLNLPRVYGIRSGHRLRNPRPAQDEIEDVVRVRQRVRRAAEHKRLPRLPRPARRAARAQRRGAAPDGAHRLPPELRDSPLRQVRPEELFLSGHAQELPDHAIR